MRQKFHLTDSHNAFLSACDIAGYIMSVSRLDCELIPWYMYMYMHVVNPAPHMYVCACHNGHAHLIRMSAHNKIQINYYINMHHCV